MAISIVPTYLEDKVIMVKERSNGCYNLGAASIANLIVSLPVDIIVTLCAGNIIYFMIGIPISF